MVLTYKCCPPHDTCDVVLEVSTRSKKPKSPPISSKNLPFRRIPMGEEDRIGSYYLSLWRIGAKSAAKTPLSGEGDLEEEAEEEMPTELDTVNSSGGFSIVGQDKLSVKYPSNHLHGHDVGVVQANKPAPSKTLLFYFEITVNSAGAKGQVAIGFTAPGFKLRRHPGWESNSYGYHGDDGLLYRGQGKGEAFGPTYTTGDTVGCGINYADQHFFFTKNGEIVGSPVPKEVKGPLLPTVSVHSQNEEVTVNFGKDPFVFDLKDFEARIRADIQSKIGDISIPQNTSYGIVRSYLQHYGYEETLASLELATKSSIPPISLIHENNMNDEEEVYALNERRTLRQLIRSGDIVNAFSKLQNWYPTIVQDEKSAICFLLHCQEFIELVRKGFLDKAVLYGRNFFYKFDRSSKFEDLAKDCAALLAYEDPLSSSLGYLLQPHQRELVADAVNAMILATNPNEEGTKACLHSKLEQLLRQLSACFLEKRSLNGDQGEAFHLWRILDSRKGGKCKMI